MRPNQLEGEWLEVRSNPEEFAAAVAIDKQIREKDPFAFSYIRLGVPLDQVDWSQPQMEFERACNSGSVSYEDVQKIYVDPHEKLKEELTFSF